MQYAYWSMDATTSVTLKASKKKLVHISVFGTLVKDVEHKEEEAKSDLKKDEEKSNDVPSIG